MRSRAPAPHQEPRHACTRARHTSRALAPPQEPRHSCTRARLHTCIPRLVRCAQGNIAPVGNFDPLNLLEGKTKEQVYRYREAEITHGRVAMLAAAGFLIQVRPF